MIGSPLLIPYAETPRGHKQSKRATDTDKANKSDIDTHKRRFTMAKLLKLKCPECNAPLDIDLSKPVKYCMYCGTPIFFDDGVKRIEINSKHEKVIKDEAKIIEAKNRLAIEKERTKQATAETRDMIWSAVLACVFFGISMLLLYFS